MSPCMVIYLVNQVRVSCQILIQTTMVAVYMRPVRVTWVYMPSIGNTRKNLRFLVAGGQGFATSLVVIKLLILFDITAMMADNIRVII
jgi:hypothetical protein